MERMNKVITNIKNNNGRINWKSIVNQDITIEYRDKRYIVTIDSYDVHKRTIYVKYKNNITPISTSSFMNGHFGEILKIRTSEFRYNIADIVKTNTGEVEILARYKDKNKRKLYQYKCCKCNCVNNMTESWLIRGNSCPVCGNKKVMNGINDIATTHPYLVKYFKNKDDATKYTYSSSKEIEVCCPDCGLEHNTLIDRLYSQGFSCKRCGDGISFGEKVMFNVLEQLGLEFIPQLSKRHFEWCGKFKYDFYISSFGIIEIHGKQHYEEGFSRIKTTRRVMTLKEIQDNDKLKMKLAIDNGISKDNYVVIDCRESNLKWIKSSILNSKLNQTFDLSTINWDNVQEYINTNLVKKACELKNNNPNFTCEDIGKIMSVGSQTIRKWLKQGHTLKWCIYDANIEAEKGRAKGRKNKRKQVLCVNNGEIFDSVKDCAKKSKKVFGIELLSSGISAVCRGEQPSYKKLIFQYI